MCCKILGVNLMFFDVFFNNITIKKRITWSYIIFILIPLIGLSSYSYLQTKNHIKSQLVNTLHAETSNLTYNIKSKMELIESVSDNICFNYQFQSFLSNNGNNISEIINETRTNVLPLVDYAMLFHRINIRKITVYFNNDNIPEGFGIFYHIDHIDDNHWYRDFIKSNKGSQWILFNSPSNNNKHAPGGNTISYVQKITSQYGEYLGIIVIDVFNRDLFSQIDEFQYRDDYSVFVIDNDNILFSNRQIDADSVNEIIEISQNTKEYLTDNNTLYVINDIDELGIKIGISAPLSLTASSIQLATLLGIVLITIILISFFYILLDTIIKNINNHISIMEKSIHSNFNIKIPVKRNDEIGQLAQGFNTLLDKISSLMNDIINKELAHRDTQLKALQYQINPHFIYNTLDIFSSKAEIADLYDLSDAITSFAKILRYNINSESIYTTIETEIQHVKNYIDLQKLKYDDKIKLSVHIPENIKRHPIIKFVLQPLVENSINHGFKEEKELNISIHGQLTKENTIEIIVEDDGTGIETERLAIINKYLEDGQHSSDSSSDDSNNIGIKNINKRLKLFYGNEYHLKIESVKNVFTKIYITIPYIKHEKRRSGNIVYRNDS